MTEDTFEYLRDCTFMMRDDAYCNTDTKVVAEINAIVDAIELAVDLAIGSIEKPNIICLRAHSRIIVQYIADLTQKYINMTWSEKVEDMGNTMMKIYYMNEVNKILGGK